MLSPIIPTVSLTIEDIPNLDIFTRGVNISNCHSDDFRPMFASEGASPLANELEQAGIFGASDSEVCHAKKMRKQTACETELELSLESNSSDSTQPLKRKQSLLEGLEIPKASKFEKILLEDEDSIDGHHFLGKRECLSDNDTDFGLNHLSKNKSQPSQGNSPCNQQVNPSFSCSNSNKKTCVLGHRLGALSSGAADCYLCRSVSANIKRFAEEKGGCLLSSELTLEVTLGCENGHRWTVCYKKATKSWCKDCKVKRKQVLKDMLQAEDERISAERKMRQEKLFEDARKRVLQSEESKKHENRAELDNLKIVLEEITRIASKYAREYCQKDESADFDQTLLLYQTLILPDKCMTTYFDSLNKSELRKEFRRYTILLHPDKNSHPKAKQAFQKAYGLLGKYLDPSN
jgi:hypothetical protein